LFKHKRQNQFPGLRLSLRLGLGGQKVVVAGSKAAIAAVRAIHSLLKNWPVLQPLLCL
jgi:hypothetical protein